MKKNMGHIDKIIRVCAGAIIILAGAYFKTMWGLAGMIPILSAEIGFCPLYRIFGIDTAKKKNT